MSLSVSSVLVSSSCISRQIERQDTSIINFYWRGGVCMSSIFLFRTLQVLLSPATNLLAPANTILPTGSRRGRKTSGKEIRLRSQANEASGRARNWRIRRGLRSGRNRLPLRSGSPEPVRRLVLFGQQQHWLLFSSCLSDVFKVSIHLWPAYISSLRLFL